jgi:hypothetical protein
VPSAARRPRRCPPRRPDKGLLATSRQRSCGRLARGAVARPWTTAASTAIRIVLSCLREAFWLWREKSQ